MSGPLRRVAVAGTAAAALVAGALTGMGSSTAELPLAGVSAAHCRPSDLPETDIQGRVPTGDYASGRAAQGYTCNTALVGHHGASGGLKVQRYTDESGRTCAYYDASVMLGLNLDNLFNGTGLGVVVLDMTDPANPEKTANLISPAMLNPHESLLVNQRRGLLAATLGTLATAPGILDVYDISDDCRHPKLQSISPFGVMGHESGFAPDGKTFWSAGAAGYTLTAVDLTNPRAPRIVYTAPVGVYHGVRLSGDGRTMYVANMGTPSGSSILEAPSLRVLDVSEVQDREPSPKVRQIGEVTWPEASIPQVAEPFSRGGRKYVLEVDEFSDWFGDGILNIDFQSSQIGAARIIDVTDPTRPRVVSNLRLDVHDPEHRTEEVVADPGGDDGLKTYAGHYCSVPTRRAPNIAACSMIASGLRLFDIRDPKHPREIGYFNQPGNNGGGALASPAWDVRRGQVWYSDIDEGFFAVGLRGRARDLLRR